MDKFELLEIKGRTLWKSFLDQIKVKDWYPTPDKYNPVDGFFTHKQTKVAVEIKTRDYKYWDYDTHLLEQSKYLNILKTKDDNKLDSVLYANFFGDNLLFIYKLHNLDLNACKCSEILCNKTTASDTGKEYKNTIQIPKELAQIFILKDNRWSKTTLNELKQWKN